VTRLIDGLPVAEFGFRGTPLRATLVDAILRGEKTATASLVQQYERDEEDLPRPGTRSVVVDNEDRPLAVIETTEVRLLRVGDVDLQFALDEGEASSRWRAGVAPTTTSGAQAGEHVTDETAFVAERFRLVERL
jgi:uncharacterized protein YhfF